MSVEFELSSKGAHPPTTSRRRDMHRRGGRYQYVARVVDILLLLFGLPVEEDILNLRVRALAFEQIDFEVREDGREGK